MMAEITPPPVHVRLIGYLQTRSDMEIVNGLAGVGTGIVLILPGPSLTISPAFSTLATMMPEWVWGVGLLLSGLSSFFAWFCHKYRCRLATMMLWVVGWAFLTYHAAVNTSLQSVVGGICAALLLGSFIAYQRIHEYARTPHNGL